MLPILASDAFVALCTLSNIAAATQPASEAPDTAVVAPFERAPAPDPLAADAASMPLSETLAHMITSSEPADPMQATGEYKNLYKRFNLSIGAALYANFNTTLQVNSDSAGVGAVVDMEDLLGVDDTQGAARLDAQYSFNKRHRIDLAFYDIHRSGSRQINDDITIGGVVIPASIVDSTFKTNVLKLAYRYNFVTDERTVIGASFGFHTLQTKATFRSAQFNVDESFRMAAPLPVIGLHAGYALSHKWTLNGDVELLQIDIGSYAGFIEDTKLTLDHDTFENFGWGVGFNGFQLDGKAEGNGDLKANMSYGYQSVMLYLRWFF